MIERGGAGDIGFGIIVIGSPGFRVYVWLIYSFGRVGEGDGIVDFTTKDIGARCRGRSLYFFGEIIGIEVVLVS